MCTKNPSINLVFTQKIKIPMHGLESFLLSLTRKFSTSIQVLNRQCVTVITNTAVLLVQKWKDVLFFSLIQFWLCLWRIVVYLVLLSKPIILELAFVTILTHGRFKTCFNLSLCKNWISCHLWWNYYHLSEDLITWCAGYQYSEKDKGCVT